MQISDIWVEDTDLVIATHGRSFYVLDDIGPLRQFSPEFLSTSDVVLFTPEDAIRSYRTAQIRYWVKKPAQAQTIETLPDGTNNFRPGDCHYYLHIRDLAHPNKTPESPQG